MFGTLNFLVNTPRNQAYQGDNQTYNGSNKAYQGRHQGHQGLNTFQNRTPNLMYS